MSHMNHPFQSSIFSNRPDHIDLVSIVLWMLLFFAGLFVSGLLARWLS